LNEKPELWKEEFVISSRRQIWKLLAMEQEWDFEWLCQSEKYLFNLSFLHFWSSHDRVPARKVLPIQAGKEVSAAILRENSMRQKSAPNQFSWCSLERKNNFERC
jgi:hypothetical protein